MTDVVLGRDRPLVLVAEDDPDVRDLIERKLRGDGMDVLAVSDGVAALHACRTARPDLVLLDVAMPGMSGFDVCRTVKADQDQPSPPVIFLSARAQPEDVDEGLAAGAADYVVKPFSPADLVRRTVSVLERDA